MSDTSTCAFSPHDMNRIGRMLSGYAVSRAVPTRRRSCHQDRCLSTVAVARGLGGSVFPVHTGCPGMSPLLLFSQWASNLRWNGKPPQVVSWGSREVKRLGGAAVRECTAPVPGSVRSWHRGTVGQPLSSLVRCTALTSWVHLPRRDGREESRSAGDRHARRLAGTARRACRRTAGFKTRLAEGLDSSGARGYGPGPRSNPGPGKDQKPDLADRV